MSMVTCRMMFLSMMPLRMAPYTVSLAHLLPGNVAEFAVHRSLKHDDAVKKDAAGEAG